ncbi:amidase family protein [Pseudomonas sp. dw_358]|uniref:amidase n=1 Tax=Pseudomonas sp. dw_358 TaxID=2720083 RepID=UPI001BD5327B
MNDTDLLRLDAHQLSHAYAAGELDPETVAEAVLKAAERAGQAYNATTSLNADDALAAARASAERWRAGTPRGALDGVPITFKDSFNVAGLPRWHGSAVNTGAVSGADCAPVKRAREAGMSVIGKTSMPDYGLLMSGLSSHSGIVRNPWNPTHNTSGSSAGAAACLAAGVAPLALGTDMVGSVRLPAAVCGLVAIHATQGRVAYDPPGNYRGAGPMARTVADAAALLAVVGQHDRSDHFALPGAFVHDAPPFKQLRGVRIAVLPRLSHGTPVDSVTARAVQQQAALLGELDAELTWLGDFDLAPEDYQAVYHVMVHKGLAELYAQPPERRARVLPPIGEMLDGALLQTALEMDQVHRRIAQAVARLERQLAPFDYVLSPALPVRHFAAEAISPSPEMGAMSHMGFACWFNQLGRPAGTVPVYQPGDGGCPVSVQIAGRRFDDSGVLQLMALLENLRGFAIDFPIVSLEACP